VAGFLSMAVANAQFRPPKLPAKPAGYIVIDSIKPGIGRLVLALDADGDGSLSRAEIANASVALGWLDRNGDGQLDSAETGKQGALEVQGQRSGFVLSYGLKHSECHDLKQVLRIPKIITLRVTEQPAFYADIDKGVSNLVNVQLVGTTADLAGVLPLPLERGRFLEQRDNVHFMPVAVLGLDVASKLFPLDNPIGKIVKLGTDYYYVIGVLKEGDPRPMAVYIPEATMRSRIGYREVKRQSGGITASEYEITKAWIPVKDASQAGFLLREITRRLDPKKERKDLHIKYVPTK